MPDRLAALDSTLRLQHGAFSRQQAHGAGFTDAAVLANVQARRWKVFFPGVYLAFTGPAPWMTRVWAGLLWAGPGAAVCDATALDLHGFTASEPVDTIHVAVDHQRRVVEPAGIELHRHRCLENFVHPVRIPRTVRVEDAALHRASALPSVAEGLGVLADVCQQRLTTPRRLRDALARRPKLKSRKAMWSVLDDISTGAHSFLEVSYLRRVERAHRLPRLDRQAGASSLGRRVWRDGEYAVWGVIHELDGRLGHEWADDRAADRRRDLIAAGQGRVTLRHGYADVVDDACQTAALVGRVLQARGWQGAPVPCGKSCTLSTTLSLLEPPSVPFVGLPHSPRSKAVIVG